MVEGNTICVITRNIHKCEISRIALVTETNIRIDDSRGKHE